MKLRLTFLLFLITSSATQAGVVFEPMMAFPIVRSGEYNGQGEAKYSLSGVTFAMRAGLLYPSGVGGGFYIGTSLASKLSRDDNTVDFDYDASRNDLGLYLTYQYEEIPIRGFFQYFLASGLEVTDEEARTINEINYEGRKFRGNGLSLGAGFTGLPYVAINLEYRHYSYDESEQFGQTDTSRELSLNELLLSVEAK